jgi:hypothetical protein
MVAEVYRVAAEAKVLMHKSKGDGCRSLQDGSRSKRIVAQE